MPRLSVFDTHEEGDRWRQALMTGTDPKTGAEITQREIAKKMGITEQAAGQYKKRELKKVKKKTAQKIVKKKELIEEQAELRVDEIEILERNIMRLENMTAPLYSALSMVFEQSNTEEILYGMNQQTKGVISLIRGLLAESGKLIESFKKVKGELAPEIHTVQIQNFKTQVLQINEFLFEHHPELLDKYESWLIAKRGDK